MYVVVQRLLALVGAVRTPTLTAAATASRRVLERGSRGEEDDTPPPPPKSFLAASVKEDLPSQPARFQHLLVVSLERHE